MAASGIPAPVEAMVDVEQAQLAPRPLGWRNVANLAAYVVNSIITYTSLTGIYGPTNTELSKKYQTLVTPAGWAFAIWGPIFIAEGAWVVAQLLKPYRAHPAVEAGTPWWLAACLFQVCWTFAFAQEVIWLSLVMMLGILGSLLGMAIQADRTLLSLSFQEYALLRAPFALHLGWILCASAVNTNVLADYERASPGTLLGVAVTSLAAILAVVTAFTLATKSAEPVVGLVAAWALTAVASELGDPVLLLDPAVRWNYYPWGATTLEGIRIAASAVAAAAGVMAAVAAARLVWAGARRGAFAKCGVRAQSA